MGLNGLALFGQGISTALIALGVGFIVCDIASRQKDFLKNLGYIISAVIMVLSLILAVNSFASSLSLAKRLSGLTSGRGVTQQRMIQPYVPGTQPQNQTQVQ